MKKIPIIVGIDPGTTTGLALLDIEGNVLFSQSKKDFEFRELIEKSVMIGLPILIGTDKRNIPDLIARFSAKTGCIIVSPDDDLKQDEKREILSGYSFSDDHEGDAIASAFFAMNRYRSLIDRIKKVCLEMRKQYLFHELVVYVLRERLPIREAIKLIEDKGEEAQLVKKALEERKFEKTDFFRIFSRLKNLMNEVRFLKSQNQSLINAQKKGQKEIELLRSHRTSKSRNLNDKVDQLFTFKEKRLRDFSKELERKDREIQNLKNKTESLTDFMAKSSGKYIMKRIKNLGTTEYNFKREKLLILPGDILFVDDLKIVNSAVIERIEREGIIVVSKSDPDDRLIESKVEIVRGEDLNIIEEEDFALIDRNQVDQVLAKKRSISKLIKEYKESRNFSEKQSQRI